MHSVSSSLKLQNAVTQRIAPSGRSRGLALNCVAAHSQEQANTVARHLAAGIAALQLITFPAQAMWDGESAAIGSCPIGEAGAQCRTRVLSRDQLGSYSEAANNAAKISSKTTGTPVADLGGEFGRETAILGDSILLYIQGDVYDENRPALVKDLKTKGYAWVSKYARGGSARTASARKFYIAVDAVQGHLASNGFAPFPKNKVAKVAADVTGALELIAEGK